MKIASKPFCWYSCAIMTTLNHILISLSSFEVVSILALFGPETAVLIELFSGPNSREEGAVTLIVRG